MLIINSIVNSEKDHNILVMAIKNTTSLARFGWQRLRVLCLLSYVTRSGQSKTSLYWRTGPDRGNQLEPQSGGDSESLLSLLF